MGYRFKKRESVREGVRRIAREQLEKAIVELKSPELSIHEKIHQVRKRFKKIRALARLVRSGMGEQYQGINIKYRDLGSTLSSARDAETLVETLCTLKDEAAQGGAVEQLEQIGKLLVAERDSISQAVVSLATQLEALAGLLGSFIPEVNGWEISGRQQNAVFKGLEKTYRQTKTAMKRCLRDGSSEQWHEWRKMVKYHCCHMGLVQGMAGPHINARKRELSVLAELLGHDHDLAVLRAYFDNPAVDFSGIAQLEIETLCRLSVARSRALRTEAMSLGRTLFSQSAGSFRKSIRSWRALET